MGIDENNENTCISSSMFGNDINQFERNES